MLAGMAVRVTVEQTHDTETLEAMTAAAGDRSPWRLAVEGTPTGDGREWAAGAFTWADLPMPFMATDETSEAHQGARLVGHIVEIERDGNDIVGVVEQIASTDERVLYLQSLLDAGDLTGVSVDLDMIEGEIVYPAVDPDLEVDESGDIEYTEPLSQPELKFSASRIRGATAVPFPAFAEAKSTGRAEMVASLETGVGTVVTAAVDGPWTSTVLVAVPADPERYVVDGGLPADELHVTIGYYGDDPDPETVDELKAVVDTFEGWAVGADVVGVARLGGDDPQGVVLLLEADGLNDVRELMPPVPAPYPHFIPHMTLGYGVDMPAPGSEPDVVELDRVELWMAGERYPGSEMAADDEVEEIVDEIDEEAPVDEPEPEPVEASAVVASVTPPSAPPAEWFDDPQLPADADYQVTDEGRIMGRLAVWGECHIGMPGCVQAPRSKANYAAFHHGPGIVCADGERVQVGKITVRSGHAGLDQDWRKAREHYDNTGWVAADVRVGEDEHGIWMAGAVRPNIDPDRLREYLASEVSGDWRAINGHLELVAVAAVNAPGFPRLAARVASGERLAMVAAIRQPAASACGCGDHSRSACGCSAPVDQAAKLRYARLLGRHPEQRRAELVARVKASV